MDPLTILLGSSVGLSSPAALLLVVLACASMYVTVIRPLECLTSSPSRFVTWVYNHTIKQEVHKERKKAEAARRAKRARQLDDTVDALSDLSLTVVRATTIFVVVILPGMLLGVHATALFMLFLGLFGVSLLWTHVEADAAKGQVFMRVLRSFMRQGRQPQTRVGRLMGPTAHNVAALTSGASGRAQATRGRELVADESDEDDEDFDEIASVANFLAVYTPGGYGNIKQLAERENSEKARQLRRLWLDQVFESSADAARERYHLNGGQNGHAMPAEDRRRALENAARDVADDIKRMFCEWTDSTDEIVHPPAFRGFDDLGWVGNVDLPSWKPEKFSRTQLQQLFSQSTKFMDEEASKVVARVLFNVVMKRKKARRATITPILFLVELPVTRRCVLLVYLLRIEPAQRSKFIKVSLATGLSGCWSTTSLSSDALSELRNSVRVSYQDLRRNRPTVGSDAANADDATQRLRDQVRQHTGSDTTPGSAVTTRMRSLGPGGQGAGNRYTVDSPPNSPQRGVKPGAYPPVLNLQPQSPPRVPRQRARSLSESSLSLSPPAGEQRCVFA